jgi:dCTP deaminase
MIFPFHRNQVTTHNSTQAISYGLSGHGYDVTCAPEFKVFTNTFAGTVIDPKNFDPRACTHIEAEQVLIPPHGFVLTSSVEYFKIPGDVLGLVLGKSTLARCGVQTICTPLEAGWEGFVTLEFVNSGPLPVILRAYEGCAQVLFLQGKPAAVNYRDRKGKYQGQEGITLPKML